MGQQRIKKIFRDWVEKNQSKTLDEGLRCKKNSVYHSGIKQLDMEPRWKKVTLRLQTSLLPNDIIENNNDEMVY